MPVCSQTGKYCFQLILSKWSRVKWHTSVFSWLLSRQNTGFLLGKYSDIRMKLAGHQLTHPASQKHSLLNQPNWDAHSHAWPFSREVSSDIRSPASSYHVFLIHSLECSSLGNVNQSTNNCATQHALGQRDSTVHLGLQTQRSNCF